MARKESPENHLATIAAVAAISLVLIQTITDGVPSTHRATRAAAAPSCARSTAAVAANSVHVPTAPRVRINCLQGLEKAR
jgi:hypothetical protein